MDVVTKNASRDGITDERRSGRKNWRRSKYMRRKTGWMLLAEISFQNMWRTADVVCFSK